MECNDAIVYRSNTRMRTFYIHEKAITKGRLRQTTQELARRSDGIVVVRAPRSRNKTSRKYLVTCWISPSVRVACPLAAFGGSISPWCYLASYPGLLPPKNHLRIINTYGACARGGGRRPGYEARCYLASYEPPEYDRIT